MKTFLKNLAWVFLAFIIISIIFSAMTGSFAEKKQIALNDLALKINALEVEKITVSGNDLTVKLKDGAEMTAKKEAEASLSETLANYGVDQKAFREIPMEVKDESGFQFWASVLIPTLLPIIAIGVIFWLLFRNAKSGMNQAFTFGQSKLKAFNPFKNKIDFDDVAGLYEAKQELKEVVEFLKNPKKFTDLGAKIPRGVLLVGSPGTGKTLIARAVAGEAGVPFFHMSASEFVEMFVGVGASRTRDAFETAKNTAPSILFIDEIDAVGRQRGAGLGGGHDEREQTLNQILVEMDGFDRETRVIVLAATNRPDILDPALLRPGRFDRRIILDLPDIREREEILKIHAKDKIIDKDADLKKVAVRTPGFSGADLANLMNEAAIFAARKNKKSISQQDIFDSVEKVILGPERKSRVTTEKERKITAYHEAGHGLVSALIPEADPVHKISIISRGMAGGYTLKLPLEDRRLKSREQFLADLAMMFGGYAAEKAIFHDMTTGASNDLKVAFELARRMVTKYGMSEKIGPVAYDDSEETVFLGREIMSEKHYSEETAKLIDAETEKLIREAEKKAEKIIAGNKKTLKAIADALLEKEILEKEEFEEIIKKAK
ncbi:MAG: ATP-dependent zinc metalloprotease FtsH [Candidatus Paceibacterota bacterium]